MRNIIIILLFSMIFYGNIRADCTISTACESEQFPYEFCNSGNLVTKCSANPYGESPNIPLKTNACFNYDTHSYCVYDEKVTHHHISTKKYTTPIGEDEDGYDYYGFYDSDTPIYDINTNEEILGYYDTDGTYYAYSDGDLIYQSYYTEIDNPTYTYDPCNEVFTDMLGKTAFDYTAIGSNTATALSAWTSCCDGCTPNNSYIQNCCVTISWSQSSKDFNTTNSTSFQTPGITHREVTSDCNYNCSNLYIYLNQTNDFTGATDDDPCDYSQFFITGSVSKTGRLGWWSLTATIMHEMGHILGFGDEYSGEGLKCANKNSIMNNTNFNDPNRGLSDDDKCMYKKLYCPVKTAVEEIKATEIAIKVFPNPTNINSLNMQISNPFDFQMNYEIVSPIGTSVISGNILSNENTKTINLEGLPTGVYLIILNYNNIKKIEKFVINK